MNNKVHVKTGDEVIVINGKNRGMKGKVLQVAPLRARSSSRASTLLPSM